jgi:hypothetical protein
MMRCRFQYELFFGIAGPVAPFDRGIDRAGLRLFSHHVYHQQGRFVSGLALDRFPAHLVAAVAMGLPSIGLILLAAHLGTRPIVMLAVIFIGFSLGRAEHAAELPAQVILDEA